MRFGTVDLYTWMEPINNENSQLELLPAIVFKPEGAERREVEPAENVPRDPNSLFSLRREGRIFQ
jgi:hypothetical protein